MEKSCLVKMGAFKEFLAFVDLDGNRRDLYLSATDSTLAGLLVLALGVTVGIEFVSLSGVIVLAIGLVFLAVLLNDYLKWRTYQKKLVRSSAAGA